MHTEPEAREKWCPAARTAEAHSLAPSFNRVAARTKGRGPHGRADCQCIASDCMWWRWGGHRVNEDGKLVQGLVDVADHESDDHVTALGYCGMASP